MCWLRGNQAQVLWEGKGALLRIVAGEGERGGKMTRRGSFNPTDSGIYVTGSGEESRFKKENSLPGSNRQSKKKKKKPKRNQQGIKEERYEERRRRKVNLRESGGRHSEIL